MYHHIQGLVEDKKLGIKWIPSLLLLSDDFIKAFPAGPFPRH